MNAPDRLPRAREERRFKFDRTPSRAAAPRRARSQLKAFTLIEMLVTFVLLAVVLALAVPRFDGALTRNALSATTNALVADLAYARSEALRRATSVGVCPRNPAIADPLAEPESACATSTDARAWETGWLVYVGSIDDVRSVIRTAAGLSGRVDSLSGPVQPLRFDALGTTTASRTFDLGAGDEQRRVFVARAGGVRGCVMRDGECA